MEPRPGGPGDDLNSFNRMQHLIDEMDRSNQRIENISHNDEAASAKFPHDLECLYDEAWRSEDSDGASLQEIPISALSKNLNDSGCEIAVNSAIAEVSKDFLAGLKAANLTVESDESRLSSDSEFKLIQGFPSYARYPETGTGLSDTDWNPYGTESDTNATSPHMNDNSDNRMFDSKSISFNPPFNSTDINYNTPLSTTGHSHLNSRRGDSRSAGVFGLKPDIRTEYSSISRISEESCCSPTKQREEVQRSLDLNQTLRGQDLEPTHNVRQVLDSPSKHSTKDCSEDTQSTQYVSVIERAKMMGIPSEIVEGPSDKKHKITKSNSQESFKTIDGEEDYLGRKVEKVLYQTEYLDAVSNAHRSANVDYNMLQRDLQEIQDSLHRTLGPDSVGARSKTLTKGHGERKTPTSSDNDGDIIPSTTATPEKNKNKMSWDFAADLGYANPDGLMGDISLETYESNSHKLSNGKQTYNSEGDESRTSGSSSKQEENHVAADQALADMQEILTPSSHPFQSTSDVDAVLSNFRDRRKQIESRYEQLNNQGLAEKVYRILTNQDPNTQALDILSDVNAEEKNMKTRYALGLQDINFSTSSDNQDDHASMIGYHDDVRRRLDLSGLSVDSTRATDKSSMYVPTSKGFTAFDDMSKFLSSQMAKASERTFNHSIEMRVPPQTIHCYPVYRDDNAATNNDVTTEKQKESSEGDDRQGAHTRNPVESEEKPQASAQQDTYAAADLGTNRTSSPDSDQGAGHQVREKYRPYRPAGSKEVYYTESDTASVTDSVTTMESTHFGSDDARGPNLPAHVLGSRRDAPNVAGIYSGRALSTVNESFEVPQSQEKSDNDEKEQGTKSRKEDASHEPKIGLESGPGKEDGETLSINVRVEPPKTGQSSSVDAERKNARWENMMEDRHRSSSSSGSIGRTDYGKDRLIEAYTMPEGKGDLRFDADDDFKCVGVRQPFSLPADAFMRSKEHLHQRNKHREEDTEPLSLRIRMEYEDKKEPNPYDEILGLKSRIPEDFLPTAVSDNLYPRSEHTKRAVDSNEDVYSSYPRERVSPPPRVYSPTSYAQRTSKSHPEDNNHSPVRQARLSSAFRQALSPELRTAIETRTPLLSRDLEESLAQPPAMYPEHESRRRLHEYGNLPEESLPEQPAFYREHQSRRRLDEYSSLPDENRIGQERNRSLSPQSRARHERGRSLSPKNRSREERDRSHSPSPAFLARDRSISPPLFRNDNIQRRASPSSLRSRSYDGRARSPILRVRDDTRRRTNGNTGPPVIPSQRTIVNTERVREEEQARQKAKDSKTPKRNVEMTLEGMSTESEVDTEIDHEPVSIRAARLRQALQQHEDPEIRPDINALWEQFKAVNESYDSSMNSARMGAVTDLLRNPTQHMLQQYLQERDQYRVERQERAELERELKVREQRELHQSRHSSSEDDLGVGGYAQLLAKKEEERQKRRAAKKKKGKAVDTGKVRDEAEAGKPIGKGSKGAPNVENGPDSLFSIPEDSFEKSPTKSNSPTKPLKSKSQRQKDIIDPHMDKLRQRIIMQRKKVDKTALREIQRVDKLKKLEVLLAAKQKGEISDGTLELQLEEISSNSPVSDNSQDINTNNGVNSDDSTTVKDSSTEMHRAKAEKEQRIKEEKMFAEKQRLRELKQLKITKDSNNKKSQSKSGSSRQVDIQNSEIKLLKLVSEGYLTPQEAYKLAVERAASAGNVSISSEEESTPRGERLHKMYSPYSRDESFHSSGYRHSSKLKQQPSVYNSLPNNKIYHADPTKVSFGKNADRNNSRQSRGYVRPKSASSSLFSRSPDFHDRHLSESHKPGPLKKSSCRNQSPSPSRLSQNRSPANKGGIQHPQSRSPGGRLKGNVLKKRERKTDPPVCASVAWSIPMDLHPSQWEEPTPQIKNKEKQRKTQSKENKTQSRELHSKPQPKKQQNRLPLKDYNIIDQNQSEEVHEEEEKQHFIDHRRPSENDIWHKRDHPTGIPRQVWEEVCQDRLARKTNHYDVDPLSDRVQYILNRPSTQSDTESDMGNVEEKPIGKMSLQEAFFARKQSFISKCRERQKRVTLSTENRRMQECLRLEREAIFAEGDRVPVPNLHAHPYSDNLYQPKRRVLSKNEMKEMTQKAYKKLPEVVEKKESDKRADEQKLNRIRAKLFNKKVQRDTLRKLVQRQRQTCQPCR